MQILIRLIELYQAWISPLYGAKCRYIPSCSEYAKQAISRYGVKGVWMSVKRLARCNPLGGYGYDAVP